MEFRQPNSLSRAMSQILDRLGPQRVATLEFATETELRHGLEVLNEVAHYRHVGVVVTPVHKHTIELRLVQSEAA